MQKDMRVLIVGPGLDPVTGRQGNCALCDATKRVFDSKNVEYDYYHSGEQEELIKMLNVQKAPLVVIMNGSEIESHWVGFRPDMIKAFVDSQSEEVVGV